MNTSTMKVHGRSISSGDEAFTVLYEALAERVTRYIAIRVDTHQLAEDLTSQTFLKVLGAMRKGKQGRNMHAWVFGIARHVVADHYRKRRTLIPLEAAAHVPADDPTLSDHTDDKLKRERVASALEGLSPDRAEAVALRIFGGLSTAEVAEVLGKSQQATKMLVYRGIQDLKERLGHD